MLVLALNSCTPYLVSGQSNIQNERYVCCSQLTKFIPCHILIHFRPVILQRVLSASVTVDKELISSIGKGILVFAAVAPGDTEKDTDALAAKVLKMRLWDDENGVRVGTNSTCACLALEENPNSLQWRQNVQDISGEILCGG